MKQIILFDVIGLGEVLIEVDGEYPKRVSEDALQFALLIRDVRKFTLRVTKADFEKYYALAVIAGTEIGLGHYIKALRNKQLWEKVKAIKKRVKYVSNRAKKTADTKNIWDEVIWDGTSYPKAISTTVSDTADSFSFAAQFLGDYSPK